MKSLHVCEDFATQSHNSDQNNEVWSGNTFIVHSSRTGCAVLKNKTAAANPLAFNSRQSRCEDGIVLCFLFLPNQRFVCQGQRREHAQEQQLHLESERLIRRRKRSDLLLNLRFYHLTGVPSHRHVISNPHAVYDTSGDFVAAAATFNCFNFEQHESPYGKISVRSVRLHHSAYSIIIR